MNYSARCDRLVKTNKALIIGSNSSHVKRTALKILLPVVFSVFFFREVYFKPIVTQFMELSTRANSYHFI